MSKKTLNLRDTLDDTQIECKYNGYQYMLTAKSIDRLEADIKALFMEVIGGDEKLPEYGSQPPSPEWSQNYQALQMRVIAQNQLRAELRKVVDAL